MAALSERQASNLWGDDGGPLAVRVVELVDELRKARDSYQDLDDTAWCAYDDAADRLEKVITNGAVDGR
jgi:hypothetical protein